MSPDEDRTTAGAAAPNKNQAKKTNGTSASASSTQPPPPNQNGSGSALEAATGSKSSSSQASSQTSPRPSLSASCPNSPNHPAMSALTNSGDHIIYRLVLTGGPCSGKTTSQARLSTFFENLGWKVYRVPETATTLFSGGIRFPDLSKEEAEKFQENLIKVMIALERTFFTLAATCKQNCIVICDRGIMDAAAYMEKESWEKVLKSNGWNTVELRDNRYNQIIHMVTSADGAEEYYNVEDNPTRTEGLDLARQLDKRTIEAWVGHPYIDVIDNSTDFDTKIRRMIAALCRRIGIEPGDRLKKASRKAKFLVRGLPADSEFPPYQDFDVVHDYLITSNPKIQSRLRKRGQSGNWSYQHTVRRSDAGSQLVELRRQISHRDYVTMLAQRDDNHHTIYKIRRCFLWQQTYFQMDIYKVPCNQQCYGLILLDTYTTLSGDELNAKLPSFLTIVREVTNDSEYSMFNLSKRIGTRRFSSCYGTGTGGNVAMSASSSSSSSTMNGSSNDTIGAATSAPPISNGLCPTIVKSNGNLPDSNGIKTTNCNNKTSEQLNGTKQNGY